MIAESPTFIEQPITAISPLSIRQPAVTTRLRNENETEVLRFLTERPLHNAVMTGLIRDNGLESKLNRGTFYGCRDGSDALVGVALIGHGVFIDARCDDALQEFARLAQEFPRVHLLMGEQEVVERFWKYYAPNGQSKRRLCREVLHRRGEFARRRELLVDVFRSQDFLADFETLFEEVVFLCGFSSLGHIESRLACLHPAPGSCGAR